VLIADANVLLYAVNRSDERNSACRRWIEGALTGSETVGLPWQVLLAFVRLTTRVGLFPQPLAAGDAVGTVQAWLSQPAAVVPAPTSRHLDVLAGLLAGTGTGGNLVSDAHLAALAVEHDATIVTYDRDFGRFAGVRWTEPGA
jgi:toxin-antitoxin system PIN domain toxin